MYIEFFMCCLTTAILQSYTVFANVQFKMFVQKKRRKKKINDIVNQTRWDSTSCVKEKQGATESVGSCRNRQMLSGGLFVSATPTAQYVTLYPDVVNHYGVEILIHQHRLRSSLYFCRNMATRGPAEDGGATNLHCQRWSSDERRKKKRKQRTEKQDRMLIYANAVTQIWKRLVPTVGSWTEAWSSHVALRAWGNLQPTDSTCTFLLLMFTAHWSLEITGIFFLCFVIAMGFFYLLFFVFLQWGSKSIWIWGHEDWTQFQSVSGIYRSYKTLSLALLESARVLLLFLCSVPLLSLSLSAQAGSHCGIIQNLKPFCYVNVLHSLNLRCTFVWNFNVLTFWLRIVRTQFTGNHHLLQQKDSYLRCY